MHLPGVSFPFLWFSELRVDILTLEHDGAHDDKANHPQQRHKKRSRVALTRRRTDRRRKGRTRQKVEDTDGKPLRPLLPHHGKDSLRDQDSGQGDPYRITPPARQYVTAHT